MIFAPTARDGMEYNRDITVQHWENTNHNIWHYNVNHYLYREVTVRLHEGYDSWFYVCAN